MEFTIIHNNFNVGDLVKSLDFYDKALGMKEVRRTVAKDESYIIVYLQTKNGGHQLELTWLRDRQKPYDLGDNEFHLAFVTDDYEGARALHDSMGCVVYENQAMGLYFIEDPDHYWLEILPAKRES